MCVPRDGGGHGLGALCRSESGAMVGKRVTPSRNDYLPAKNWKIPTS